MCRFFAILMCVVLVSVPAACGDDDSSTATDGTESAWTEEEATFSVGPNELHGVLTVPAGDGPHSAVVIATGSESQDGSIHSGVSDRYYRDLAHRLADAGYAAFRYDTAGVGRSEGDAGIASLEANRDETIAALHRVQQHPAIRSDDVGLWGISQEAWVISMAAAQEPEDVAFIISVSGSGISVAEQQVWGVETQSRAAGLGPDDIERATLVGGLLVDWQLTEPLFHQANKQLVDKLGEGPWQEFFTLVYDSQTTSPADGLRRGIEILNSIQDEPWAQALYLEEIYLPRLHSIEPEQIELVQETVEQSLLTDPIDHLTRVTSPVLAFFGEDDIVQPTDRSAELYAKYLDEAGNDDVTIVILPEVGHDILPSMPGYLERMVQWLDDL